MITIIIFILLLSLLVIAHELGHFLTARKAGMKVYEFGLGYPPRALGVYRDPKTKKWIWVKGKGKSNLKETVGGDPREEEYPTTLYTLNWLPLGGFVKIKGENGENVKDKDSFGYHKAWKRVLVLVAGVVMNVLLAAVLLGIGFMIGLPSDVTAGADKHAIVIGNPAVVVQRVVNDSPADTAGLKLGDKVLAINNSLVRDTSEMIAKVQEVGAEELVLSIERVGENLELKATPKVENNKAQLGVYLADAAIVRFPWYIAIYKGFVAALFGVVNITIAFFLLIKNLILGNGLAFEISGPVGIAAIVGQSAKLGINYLINTAAMLSLSLAVINILPIPALDGGRVLFVIIEKILRKPLNMKYEQIAHTIGFVLLMVLVIWVTARDILGLVG